MKLSAVALFMLLLGSVAHADLAEEHQKNCETVEVKKLVGKTGSCRVVLAPKKIQRSGSCTGTFKESIPCKVSFIAFKESASLTLTCGTDPLDPTVDEEMRANALGYNVATLIKMDNGQDLVQTDKNQYSMISSYMVDLFLIDTKGIFFTTTKAAVSINLDGLKVSLTNVKCQ